MNLFCFGYGYSATAVTRLLAARGTANIRGTRRTPAADSELAFDGITRLPAAADAVTAATHVLVSIPPNEAGCPALQVFIDDLAMSPHLQWIGYLSTVGVYGDTGGAWVDETAPLKATSERAKRRVSAETAWRAFGEASSKHVDIFRLPGIYGPGRSAIDSVRAGTARRIIKPGQVFNRIHVDDIAGALAAAMALSSTTLPLVRVFNITDDEPAPPQDVIAYAATMLGIPPPPEMPFEHAALTPMAASFYTENKRVSNARMKRDLGYRLRYPTYREGLAAC